MINKYLRYKFVVIEALIEHFSPIRQRYNELINDPGYLENVLKEGTARASEIANKCWLTVREKIGFGNGDFDRAALKATNKIQTS